MFQKKQKVILLTPNKYQQTSDVFNSYQRMDRVAFYGSRVEYYVKVTVFKIHKWLFYLHFYFQASQNVNYLLYFRAKGLLYINSISIYICTLVFSCRVIDLIKNNKNMFQRQ